MGFVVTLTAFSFCLEPSCLQMSSFSTESRWPRSSVCCGIPSNLCRSVHLQQSQMLSWLELWRVVWEEEVRENRERVFFGLLSAHSPAYIMETGDWGVPGGGYILCLLSFPFISWKGGQQPRRQTDLILCFSDWQNQSIPHMQICMAFPTAVISFTSI